MGRIVLNDGLASRTIPADDLDGTIEIDLSAEPAVTVPPSVSVEQAGDDD